MRVMRAGIVCLVAVLAVVIAGCGGGTSTIPLISQQARGDRSSPSSPIQHVVIIVQENRTFNDFFATFPGTDGTTTGTAQANANCSPPIKAGPIALTKEPLAVPKDLNHSYKGYTIAKDHGSMDGFDNVEYGNKQGSYECSYPYQYTDPSQITPYWTMAQQYALAEHMFTTQGSDSFTAHQDLIRGDSVVETGKAMIDFPTCGSCHWGCDAPPGTITHLITKSSVYIKNPGPFPCSNEFSVTYNTMRDLLDAKDVSWKYYVPPFKTANGKLLSAFDVIWPVRNGPEWKDNIITPQTQILKDIPKGKLPAVSWVVPDQPESDHPGLQTDTGPSWVASIVNAVGESTYWNSTAIIIVWDDWGGFYDNLKPKRLDYGGLGFRVPAIIVSPYAKPAFISATNYEFGSILRYIEDNWNLGRLGTTDTRAQSIIDCFDYSQKKIKFKKISSQYSAQYFLHLKPSLRAPDDDM